MDLSKSYGKLAVLGVVALLAIVYVGSVFGYRGDCVRSEAGIKAQYEQNQNNYDNMWKRFKEIAQVPVMYAEDTEKVFKAAIQGRYGAGGSKAMFQFLKEQNPQLDANMYTQLQRTIEAGRISFEADQRSLIDKKRQYDTLLNGNSAVFVSFWFSYPKIDLNKFGIVTSAETDEAFTTKRSEPIKLR